MNEEQKEKLFIDIINSISTICVGKNIFCVTSALLFLFSEYYMEEVGKNDTIENNAENVKKAFIEICKKKHKSIH